MPLEKHRDVEGTCVETDIFGLIAPAGPRVQPRAEQMWLLTAYVLITYSLIMQAYSRASALRLILQRRYGTVLLEGRQAPSGFAVVFPGLNLTPHGSPLTT